METVRDCLILHATLDDVWAYYTNVRNLTKMTLPSMHMRLVKAELPLRLGSRIRFGLRPVGIPWEITWDARICDFEEKVCFADKQIRGPFEHWVHRHEFRDLGDNRIEICDTIEVGAPMGIFGRFAESMILGQKIHTLFDHRRKILRRDFKYHDGHEPNAQTAASPTG